MTMKKIVTLLMVLTLSMAITACSNNKKNNDKENIQKAYDTLDVGFSNPLDTHQEITANLILVDTYEGVSVSWVSDDTTVISNEGVITRLSYNASVELTATLTLNKETLVKKFDLIVLASVAEQVFYDYKIELPSTHLLEKQATPFVVEDAPELLIVGALLDTYQFYHYETMSGYEYIKVYNNTNAPYNLKNHRITLANPLQGQNFENAESRLGNEVLSTGFLYNALIDEDVVIPATSFALIWLKPYYWTVGSGTGAFNKPFSAQLIHKDTEEYKGAFSQTVDDFKAFWKIEDKDILVVESTNMGIAGYRAEGGTEEMFPIFSPGSSTPFTHLNSTLLRSLEISKFNDQNGTASITLLNKYSDLSPDKQLDPDPVYGKKAFNVMEIKDNNEVIDGYLYTNAWKYFDPIVRINFLGLVNVSGLAVGQTSVSFTATSNPGIKGWSVNTELQFRPPLPGERIMQLQLPLRELPKYQQYMLANELEVVRFATENVTQYRFVEATIKLITDPSQGLEFVNFRTDEVYSEGRMRASAPADLFVINLTRP
jgi:hypothetical protein